MQLLLRCGILFFFLGQVAAQDLEPARVSCNAAYSAPCARQNSQWLASTTAKELDDLLRGGHSGLTWVTDKFYNLEENFYPFVFSKTTMECVAHGANPSFVGKSLSAIFQEVGIGYSDVSALHDRFVAAANSGGDWVRYLWSDGGRATSKLAFVTSLADQYYLGVGYEDEQLPPDLPCSDRYDSWCSITNVRSLLGKAQFRLNQAESLENFEAGIFHLSFDESHRIEGGFYTFMYSYDGRLKSHAVLHSFFGKTLWDIVQENGLGTYEEGFNLNQKFVGAAEGLDSGWVQYPWRNSLDEPTYTKIAYIVKIEFGGTEYYLGAGYNLAMDEIASGPFGSECSAASNHPCAFRSTLQLTSHVLSSTVSSPMEVNDMFNSISRDETFKIGQFYPFVYDFNQTCVAHGLVEDFVGMSLSAIFRFNGIPLDADLLHNKFRTAAEQGGGWVLYDWLIPGQANSDFQKISYIFRMNIDGRDYYGGVGFNHQQAPVEPFADTGLKRNKERIPCSQDFGLNCSEINSRSILGQALTELTLASSEARVTVDSTGPGHSVGEVVGRITAQDPDFRVNDFFVMVFSFAQGNCTDDSSGCCLAHGANESMVGRTWNEILDAEGVTSIIQGAELHRRLMRASNTGGAFIEYPWRDSFGVAQSKRSWTARFRNDGESFYVVAEYLLTPQPATCDSCPHGMECTFGEQAYCTVQPEPPIRKDPIFRAVIAVFCNGILFVCFFFGWRHERSKARSRAKISDVEAKMMVLAEQLERQMVGMVEVEHDLQIQSPETYRQRVEQMQRDGGKAMALRKGIWFWAEDQSRLSLHEEGNVKPHTNFVKYPSEVSDQIDHAYLLYLEGRGYRDFRFALNDKSQPGGGSKGSMFEIDFLNMTQRNMSTGHERKVQRDEFESERIDADMFSILPPLPDNIEFGDGGEDLLPTFKGQVLQVSKMHPSRKWYFGTVLYDPLLNDVMHQHANATGDNSGLNDILVQALHDRPTSGWFPKVVTKPADVRVMKKLINSLGGEGLETLNPPVHWNESPQIRIDVIRGSQEYHEVVEFFLRACHAQREYIFVERVERIQNLALWQSFSVKRQSMKSRDEKNPGNRVNNRDVGSVEYRGGWLFHGTTAEIAAKIEKQGFNRAFAGRNAVAYGRGVYFARDASYSSHPAYSNPDEDGIQRIFLCRVAVGDWCKGRKGQLTPDPKPHSTLELFDSTVDNVSNPSIFVVYHDAQAYPEYVVSFRRSDQ